MPTGRSQTTRTAVKASSPEPYTEYVVITPRMAEDWLSRSVVQRTIRPGKVAAMAMDIRNGSWTFNNDAVCVDKERNLLNGQHRMLAIIESGTPTKFLVQFNTPPESMKNIDTGTARTLSDYLKFASEINTTTLAATIRILILLRTGGGLTQEDSKKNKITTTQASAFLEDHPEIRASVDFTVNNRRSLGPPPGPSAAAHYLISQTAGQKYADYYFKKLVSLSDEPTGSAVLAVDNRVRTIREQHQKIDYPRWMALLIKGYNYYAKDARVRKLDIRNRDDTSFKIPVPVKWSREKID